jgi:hypothetical protein
METFEAIALVTVITMVALLLVGAFRGKSGSGD